MRILFTNNTLDRPAGSELSAADAICRLLARGHEPAAFSRQLGELAESIRQWGVLVVDQLDDLPETWIPDVIHGHHFWETGLAAIRFPEAPVISFCRGPTPWQEFPCQAPNVVAYVAVDEDCRERLLRQASIGPDMVSLILNGVDEQKFPPREPLPVKPKRVLVFSNYARENNYFAAIREACVAEGIECQGVGCGMGNSVCDPAPLLMQHDLVFAKGKAALEALFVGCGVIVCDDRGLGELVVPQNFEELRRRSFGYSCMPHPVSKEMVLDRFRQWNSEIQQAACAMARTSASLDATMDRLLEMYATAVDDWKQMPRPSAQAMQHWAVKHFSSATHAFKLGRELQELIRERESRAPRTTADETAELNRLLALHRQTDAQIAKLEGRLAIRDTKIASLRERLRLAKAEIEALKNSKRWWRFWRK